MLTYNNSVSIIVPACAKWGSILCGLAENWLRKCSKHKEWYLLCLRTECVNCSSGSRSVLLSEYTVCDYRHLSFSLVGSQGHSGFVSALLQGKWLALATLGLVGLGSVPVLFQLAVSLTHCPDIEHLCSIAAGHFVQHCKVCVCVRVCESVWVCLLVTENVSYIDVHIHKGKAALLCIHSLCQNPNSTSGPWIHLWRTEQERDSKRNLN